MWNPEEGLKQSVYHGEKAPVHMAPLRCPQEELGRQLKADEGRCSWQLSPVELQQMGSETTQKCSRLLTFETAWNVLLITWRQERVLGFLLWEFILY